MNDFKRRVVVTGLGLVSPLGNDLSSFSKNLKAGVSGKGPITQFDTTSFPVKEAYLVRDFGPKKYGVQILDPFIQYAVAAADSALKDAKFGVTSENAWDVGISVSSSKGGVHTLDRFKERFQKRPSALLGARIYANMVPNFAAQWIARKWKIKGPAKCYVAACATGTMAVVNGMHMIQDGTVDYCLAGASDASVVPLMLAGYRNMKALSPDHLRPYDKRRKGFMVGEGAGILFLESLESALKRGVFIYGEIVGADYCCDGTHALNFLSESNALSHSLKHLLNKCDWQNHDVDYLNLHGTGTVAGDYYETQQLKTCFGKEAYEIPMSSIKSMTGHMLGASGAIEIMACFIAMKEGFIPPTVGLEQPDPECDLDYTAEVSRTYNVNRAISVAMGFGGHVATIALQRSCDD